MKIIVGLGNPGKQYEKTRHNAGFLMLDKYLENKEVIVCASSFDATICEMHQNSTKIFFVKPQTFMNKSGEAVKQILNFYKADAKTDLLVIHDEKDLAFGVVRSTSSSSSAGHNGVQNIIDELGTQDFNRIRIGVESRESDSQLPTEAFVLQPFSEEEYEKLFSEVYPEVEKEIDNFLTL